MKHSTLIKVFTMALLTTLPIGKMWAGTSSTSYDGVSHESLLKGYVQQMLDEALPASKRTTTATRRSAAAQLTGNDLIIYNKLVPEIKKIASGTITSTVISIPVTEVVAKTTWTPAEVGVSTFFQENQINKEASAFISEKIAFTNRNVLNALLSDLPYELLHLLVIIPFVLQLQKNTPQPTLQEPMT